MREDVYASDIEYLVVQDKLGTRSAPGRFYRKVEENFGCEVEFIQRSVYGTKTIQGAWRLAELAKNYGFKVKVFQIADEL